MRFRMDGRGGTVGVDKNVPVRIVRDRHTDGGGDTTAAATGFLDEGWMAKAGAPRGRGGPFALFAVDRREKAVAVFVGTYGTVRRLARPVGRFVSRHAVYLSCHNNIYVVYTSRQDDHVLASLYTPFLPSKTSLIRRGVGTLPVFDFTVTGGPAAKIPTSDGPVRHCSVKSTRTFSLFPRVVRLYPA